MNKRLIGLIIIGIALTSMTLWEFWGRENFSYQDVLVLKEDKEANSIIKKEDLVLKKMESPTGSALSEKDSEWLIGMQTVQYVAKGVELHKEYFEQSQYTVGAESGKYIMSVPEEWLLSFPKTIRCGDKVSFYNGKVKILDAVVVHALDTSGQEVISKDNERFTTESVVSRIEIVSTADRLVELSSLAGSGKRFTVLYC